MKKKYFSIQQGMNPVTKEEVTNKIVYDTWDVAKQYVQGVSGAVYKGFKSEEEAKDYLGIVNDAIKPPLKSDEVMEESVEHPDRAYFYVDGSYSNDLEMYSYGLVAVQNGNIVHLDYGRGTNKEASTMRQIGGELLGAMKALLYMVKGKHTDCVIFYDYKGVHYHAEGIWKRKSEYSKLYYEWIQSFKKKYPGIQFDFQKVDAHTGDDFNELADGLAKLALNIKPESSFEELVTQYQLEELLKGIEKRE